MVWDFSSPLPLLSGHPHLQSPESGLFDLNTTNQNLKRPHAPLNFFLHERVFPTCRLNLQHHRAHLAPALPQPMVQIKIIVAQEEVEKTLSEIQAPFTPAGPSANVSVLVLEVPESPCLSTLPSPDGYGSISQVLLPDVTPSPAVHHFKQVFDTSTELHAPMDSGTVTLLRLQEASTENTASECLVRLQELEEQLHTTKYSRVHETEELAKQVSFLEPHLHISVEARERLDEECSAFAASLCMCNHILQ
ncbi:hypothetical protein EDD22DRAFT_1020346 [Suillus occidentalis]|nr:hypothetical protein EDD22DRAFT_1020346 [Suillus occidentalis]